MGAARPRRWKLPFHRAGSAPSSPFSSESLPAAPPPCSPARPEAWAEEAVPPEFVCPVSGALMADPVILPSGQTYERACLQASAELAFLPPGVESGGADTMIPNSALKAAIGTWCARSGRAVPTPPSAEAAREAVLRSMPPAAAKSVRTTRRAAMASSSNSSYSSPASTSSYGSSSEITAAEEEVDGRPVKEAPQKRIIKEVEVETAAVDPLEDEVVAKVMEADEEGVVAAAMASLREATRESAERRRALCSPRLLGALRRVLLLPRHAAARVDATAALVNLSLEPANKVRIVRAGAVPALVEVLRSGASAAEAREHAAGSLFGLALNEDNRAAIGVLGAVPPLLDLLTYPGNPARARRDAGMALYHLSLAAVNQTKIARFPGAPKALLTVASSAAEPTPIRRLALMVVCNVCACAEGRAALMDAGAVAAVAGILSSSHDAAANRSGSGSADLEEWCVAAMYAMSRGSLRFRGLARAAGADRALRRVADEGAPGGVRREMARKTLRAMLGDLDEDDGNDLTGSSLEYGEGDDCGGSIVSDGLMSFRRRQREVGVSSCGNTAEF
ncbi:U-box domain-containing protein 39-like [Phragmites australis]|uniref:U-box domain-containing protein 39-like n=1 Tax=Phragmites australis TaxID=29695 RepID=UPI002D7A06A5|nr:U-box domain-containing protein 39-like [Phragmites australis]